MIPSEIIFKSVTELAPLIKARKLSPLELLRAYLDRIESVHPKGECLHHDHRRA
jgi:aspartyl-tRNA(Asn)/glutamyl-tRNA(Gln) amidotransferase subunit A